MTDALPAANDVPSGCGCRVCKLRRAAEGRRIMLTRRPVTIVWTPTKDTDNAS